MQFLTLRRTSLAYTRFARMNMSNGYARSPVTITEVSKVSAALPSMAAVAYLFVNRSLKKFSGVKRSTMFCWTLCKVSNFS